MPNFVVNDWMRNSVTAAAFLFALPSPGFNTSTLVMAPPDYSDLGVLLSKYDTHENASDTIRLLPVLKKSESQAKPMSDLGKRLLALRNAAIAAGMVTEPAEKLMDEFRAAREA
ncbi:hypothetical protein EC912_101748 [Luteibacter rhizovicinus]|uniref:Uncharacterized protein n=1 Tax=Luteibacter rhizovicinus TaxID=242606 RepID=A0A4R3YY98_9GAMM|nr:hypothetical protein [Luteibacter rhizovicinus]TCV97731.1 hypothetical protein EC912_101748 [Luteibacter rhizovicinus]